jgi:hypothetical protein
LFCLINLYLFLREEIKKHHSLLESMFQEKTKIQDLAWEHKLKKAIEQIQSVKDFEINNLKTQVDQLSKELDNTLDESSLLKEKCVYLSEVINDIKSRQSKEIVSETIEIESFKSNKILSIKENQERLSQSRFDGELKLDEDEDEEEMNNDHDQTDSTCQNIDESNMTKDIDNTRRSSDYNIINQTTELYQIETQTKKADSTEIMSIGVNVNKIIIMFACIFIILIFS